MSRRKLREDELALWKQVAGSTTPLPNALRRNARTGEAKPAPGKQAETVLFPAFKIGERVSTKTDSASFQKTSVSAQPVMDAKKFGKMKRGKLVPEARIDLHGMTVDQAYPALNKFILSSYARGLRLVLVITGKGNADDPYRTAPQRRGILKRQVPAWLRHAPLGPVVMDVVEAHQRHGGGGAYYVYLRRAPRG